MTAGKPSRKAPIKRFTTTVTQCETDLERMSDQLARANTAAELAEQCKLAAELFGGQRTAALNELRELGWSLGDLAVEFGLTRARVAQVACRDRYKSGESRGGGGRRRRPQD